MSEKEKTFAVFGMGLVGDAVVKHLMERGDRVVTVTQKNLNRPKKHLGMDSYLVDVGNFTDTKQIALRLKHGDTVLNGVVYAVNRDSVRKPSASFSAEQFAEDVSVQFIGMRHVFESLIQNIAVGGTMIFVSSECRSNISSEMKELVLKELRSDSRVITRRINLRQVIFPFAIVQNFESRAKKIISLLG